MSRQILCGQRAPTLAVTLNVEVDAVVLLHFPEENSSDTHSLIGVANLDDVLAGFEVSGKAVWVKD